MDEQTEGYDVSTRGAVHEAEYGWADHQVDYDKLHDLAEKAHLIGSEA